MPTRCAQWSTIFQIAVALSDALDSFPFFPAAWNIFLSVIFLSVIFDFCRFGPEIETLLHPGEDGHQANAFALADRVRKKPRS
jgi:hypothetical protein